MIYAVLFAHYLNDFPGQSFLFPSFEIGKNKSKNGYILGLHILLYTVGMWVCLSPFMGWNVAFAYAVLNGMWHLIIDFTTSRFSSYCWQKQKTGLFWSTIGFDQFLHVAILCATLLV